MTSRRLDAGDYHVGINWARATENAGHVASAKQMSQTVDTQVAPICKSATIKSNPNASAHADMCPSCKRAGHRREDNDTLMNELVAVGERAASMRHAPGRPRAQATAV